MFIIVAVSFRLMTISYAKHLNDFVYLYNIIFGYFVLACMFVVRRYAFYFLLVLFFNVRMLWWTSSLKYACLNHSMTKWNSRKNKIPFGEFRAVFFYHFNEIWMEIEVPYLSKLILMLRIWTYVCFIALAFVHTQFVCFYLLLLILWNCACVCAVNKKKTLRFTDAEPF